MQIEDLIKSINENINTKFEEIKHEMKSEFAKVGKQFEAVNKQFAKIDKQFEEVNEHFAKIDGKFEDIDRQFVELRGEIVLIKEDITKIKVDIGGLKEDVCGLKEDVAGLKEDVAVLKERLDIVTQINLPQILLEQTRMGQEQKQQFKQLNEKIDSYIQKNEVEHKKFEYKIAEIEMKQKAI